MPKEKYYLGQINKNGSTNPMFIIYCENFKKMADTMKMIFADDPLYSFKEIEISKKQFGELEKLLKECLRK